MGATRLSEIPDSDGSSTIAADELSLVRMDNDIIHRSRVKVVALLAAGASIPHLDRPVLRASDHPLALAMKSNTSDVVGVAIEGHDRVRIRRLDVVQLDIVTSGGRKVAFVWGDAEAVHLRLGVLDRTGTDSRKGLPEALPTVSIADTFFEALTKLSAATYRMVWS